MKIIEPSVELINPPDYKTVLNTIEIAGRTCYQSDNLISDNSAEGFIRGIIKRGHESVIEHCSITVKIICDRGVTHEIVRHRLASYSQESTRYCNYSNGKFGEEITVIKPLFFAEGSPEYKSWKESCLTLENAYKEIISKGGTAQEARSILPTSLKATLIMTANIREWRHFLKLRCSSKSHPQMGQVANMIKAMFIEKYPVFFSDLEEVKE